METSGQIDYSSSEIIFKWWTIITLGVNIAVAALILLFLTVGPGQLKETGTMTDMLILFYHMVKEAGGIVGIVYLFIFGSNAFLLGRILYHRCCKPDQIEEKVAVRAVMSNVGIKLWTVLIVLIDIAAIVFPILTLLIRRPDTEGSYATTAGELYSASVLASGLTGDQLLHICVLLWTFLFASNTILLIHSLFHRCEA